MKRLMLTMSAFACGVAFAASPNIDAGSVSMTQSENRTAVVRYKLTGADAVVTFDIEHRDGEGNWRSIGVPIVSVAGDVNRVVTHDASAFKEIRWNARKDWPDRHFDDGSIRAKVTAWAKSSPPDYMVIDLDTFDETFYETADRIPGGIFDECYLTNKLVMRRIHAACETFVMGQQTNDAASATCEGAFIAHAPQHWVTLTNDFYIGVFEATQGQHKKLRGDGTSRSKATGDDRLPVDAISYQRLRGGITGETINWPATGTAVGQDLAVFRTRSGIDFDIPTEAEWEFACRAGTQSAFHDGSEFTAVNSGSATLGGIAWFKGNCPDDSELTDSSGLVGGLRRPGQKESNAWGLYDMAGNVSEWCRDWAGAYDLAAQPAVAPVGPSSGSLRIKRGGNWHGKGAYCASSARRANNPSYSVDASDGTNVWGNGYRLVCPATAK